MADKRVPCAYCGKPTTRRYIYLSDEDTLCAKCAKAVEAEKPIPAPGI